MSYRKERPGSDGLRALVAALIAGLFWAGPVRALAAAGPSADGPLVADVVVTGTRIQGVTALSSVSPIATITSEQIEEVGAQSLEEVLRYTPYQSGEAGNANNQNVIGGISTVNLRGLGSQRTLVLVDGHRAAPSVGVGQPNVVVDLNTIPLASVSRIETLLDGASAVYGSDAVAGVVNFVLKQDYQGASIAYQHGVTDYDDGEERRLTATAGTNFGPDDRGNISGTFQYYDRDPVFLKDRPYSECQYKDALRANGSLTTYCAGDPAHALPAGATALQSSGSSALPFGRITRPKPLTVLAEGTTMPYVASRDNYNQYADETLQSGATTKNVSLIGHYDLLQDYLTVYGEGFYTGSDNFTQFASDYESGISVPANARGNPLGRSLTLTRRFTEGGPQVAETSGDTLQAVIGAKGKIPDIETPLLNNVAWDVSYNYSHSALITRQDNTPRVSRIANSLSPSACAADASNGCSLVNYFGANTITQPQLNYLLFTASERETLEQTIASAGLTARGLDLGMLTGIEAGPIGLAMGFEHRVQQGSEAPDSVTSSGDSGDGQVRPTSGRFAVNDFYFETDIPLASHQPLADTLHANLAYRISSYDTAAHDVSSYKAGAEWGPTPDVRFRGSYSKVTRAADIKELYAGTYVQQKTVQDPCSANSALFLASATVRANCAKAVPAGYTSPTSYINITQGGNPNLKPETAHTTSYGMVLKPRAVPTLIATVDYYRVVVRDFIGVLDTQTELDNCYNGTAVCSPDKLRRGSDYSLSSNDSYFNAGNTNLYQIRTSGVDFQLSYGLDTDAIAQVIDLSRLGAEDAALAFNAGVTRLISYEEQDDPSLAVIKEGGKIGVSYAYPHWKGNFGTSLNLGPVTISHQLRWVGSMYNGTTVDPVNSIRTVSDKFYNDLQVRYMISHMTLYAGVRNLGNVEPPYYTNRSSLDGGGSYDPIGRSWYAGAKYVF